MTRTHKHQLNLQRKSQGQFLPVVKKLLICEDCDWLLQTESLDMEIAWKCEFDVSLPESNKIPEAQEESWTLLATSAKKQRTEVRLTELTPAERQEFERAKEAEVQNWIQTGNTHQSSPNSNTRRSNLALSLDINLETSRQCR